MTGLCSLCFFPGDMTHELVRHFLIETGPRGVKLKGCPNEPNFGELPPASVSTAGWPWNPSPVFRGFQGSYLPSHTQAPPGVSPFPTPSSETAGSVRLPGQAPELHYIPSVCLTQPRLIVTIGVTTLAAASVDLLLWESLFRSLTLLLVLPQSCVVAIIIPDLHMRARRLSEVRFPQEHTHNK